MNQLIHQVGTNQLSYRQGWPPSHRLWPWLCPRPGRALQRHRQRLVYGDDFWSVAATSRSLIRWPPSSLSPSSLQKPLIFPKYLRAFLKSWIKLFLVGGWYWIFQMIFSTKLFLYPRPRVCRDAAKNSRSKPQLCHPMIVVIFYFS